MITLNNFTKLDNNQYQMVLSMKKTDSVEDLPSETRPMSPEYFAVTVDYGAPADGSIVIKESGEILTYSAGEWGKAGTAGDIKLKELSVKENGEYLPESGYVGFNKVVVDVKKEMPVKGDLIMLDGKQYRVLKTNDTVAEVLAMYDANSSITFDGSPAYHNTYAGKSLDIYCNDTFYNGLSAEMKDAIIDKTFTQDSWKSSLSVPAESHYTAKYADGSLYYLSLEDATFGESITRHSYCLSIQDVVDYLESTTAMTEDNTTLTGMNIWKMVWNQSKPTSNDIWLRSADASKDYYAFFIQHTNGSIRSYYTTYTVGVRPAFQIDLSKVDWTKSE